MIKSAAFDITVTPKSSMSEIIITGDDNIKLFLNSPPADGKANEELIKLVSKKLNIAKSRVTIVKGEKSRKKRIAIEGFSKEDVLKILRR